MLALPEIVVQRAADLPACLEAIARSPRIGLDTEFIGEDRYQPQLCLVQIATESALFLIDPLGIGSLDKFWPLIIDPGRLVIVHAGREEIRMCRFWGGESPGNLFDVQIAAGLLGLGYPLGHAALVQSVLGVTLAKGETLTEWRQRPLSKNQIRYAFDDVRYLLPLHTVLTDRLHKLQRLEWAAEEFATTVQRACQDPATEERWRKLKGIGSLDRRRLAIVREVMAWREDRAMRLNRPPRSVLRDHLIVEIARRNPKRERDLSILRGLSRADVSELMEVIDAVQRLPNSELPELPERDNDPPFVSLISTLLATVLYNVCSQMKLTPNLVASGQDVKALIRARLRGETTSDDSALCRGWRSQHILPELLPVLDGRRGFCINVANADSPLELFDHFPR